MHCGIIEQTHELWSELLLSIFDSCQEVQVLFNFKRCLIDNYIHNS